MVWIVETNIVCVVEPGKQGDGPEAARLIAETDKDLFKFCTGDNVQAWEDLAKWEWREDRGIYGFRRSHVVRDETGLLGLLVSYPSRYDSEIDWDFKSSRDHMDPSLWHRITENYNNLAAFLFPTIPKDAYYVQNVVTRSSTRRLGLGRRLMEVAFELGKSEGCRACHLDVDSSSIPALKLYEKLGMRVLVKTEVPAIRGVHAHYRMVREL
jgi:ribosomal protein S18 acetylase RimI-like enzyme